MKKVILFICFCCFAQLSIAQDTTDTHLKNQFGIDLSSIILSFSEASYGLFTTNAAMYRRAITPKDYLSLKIISQSHSPVSGFITARGFFTPDSTLISNHLTATSNIQFVLNYSRKLERRYLNFYGGVTTSFMIQNANVHTFEREELTSIPTFGFNPDLIFSENRAFNFYRVGIAPSAGIEVKVGERLSILTNFNPMIYMSFGHWSFMDGDYEMHRRSLFGDWIIDTTLLRDISLMLSF